VALDGLPQQAVVAEPRTQDLRRHLSLSKARDLDGVGEICGGVLDRVVHILARHIDREPNLVLGELFDLDGHAPIQAKRFRLAAARH
jgi:hypothetical protein